MPALTIRHGGLVASGQTIHGIGRPGSVGIYVPPGLGTVVLDGLTVRGFDYGIVAESPVVITNSEFYRYGQAAIVLNGGASYVEYCSFLDFRTDGVVGAAIVATEVGGVSFANCVYYVQGNRRWVVLRDSGRAWTGQNLIGVATNVEGETRESYLTLQNAVPQGLIVTSHVNEDPRFARIEAGAENLRLLHSSAAIRAVRSTLLPALGDRYDSVTKMPLVDREGNRRAVDFLSAGAHEMSFAVTHDARIRMLELIGGIAGALPFDHAASGRGGTFVRLPGSRQNPTVASTDASLDIQPSKRHSVLTVSDSLVGGSSAYFKSERVGKVPLLVSAQPSRRSAMDGAGELTISGWAKAESANADIVVFRPGRGLAQDQAVVSTRFVFRGAFQPSLSLKLKGSSIARDYTFTVEDSEALAFMQALIDDEVWFYFGWRFNGRRAEFLVGREDENFLRSFPSRPFVYDTTTEAMVGTTGVLSFVEPHTIVDSNEAPIYVGSNELRTDAWHGFIDEIRIDIGEESSREALLAEFQSRGPLNDTVRLTKQIPKTDLLIGRDADLLIKSPGVPAGVWPGISGYFDAISKVVPLGTSLVVAGERTGGNQQGVFLLTTSGAEIVIENIPTIYDIAVDREGDLVILASDDFLSRLDFAEGVRRTVVLDDLPEHAFRTIAIMPDNGYVIGDYAGSGARIVLVRVPRDIASTDAASTELVDFEEVDLEAPVSIAVTEEGDVFVLDAGGINVPSVLKISTVRTAQRRLALGVGVAIPVGSSLVLTGVDLNALGIAPGDRLAFIAAAADLETPEGEVVAATGDPVAPDNAGEFTIRTVEGSVLGFDRAMVAEAPTAAGQFELRIYRRNSTALMLHQGAPLVGPTEIAYNPGDPGWPMQVSDPGAVRTGVSNHTGVIYRVGSVLEELWYRGNLGYDLDAMTTVALRVNPNLAPTVVASKLRSRLSWHMEIDPSARDTIVNAAFPGLSDLDVPLISLNELLLVQASQVRVEADGDDAVLVFETTFGVDPALEADFLNADYENLSEMGVVTEDGVTLLGRQTLARVPYDPLSPVLTRWRQGLRIGKP
jgi:hypothetical protein